VNRYSRLLVYNENILIFIEYVQIDMHRLDSSLLWRRYPHLYLITGFQLMMRLLMLGIDEYYIFLSEVFLYQGSRNVL
jgi:hypothetical protein